VICELFDSKLSIMAAVDCAMLPLASVSSIAVANNIAETDLYMRLDCMAPRYIVMSECMKQV